MIRSFKNKFLKSFFLKGETKKIQPSHIEKLGMILDLLHGVAYAKDMNFPGSNFHPLKGDRKNTYSVSVNGNWRVTFRFENHDAYDVDYLDYH